MARISPRDRRSESSKVRSADGAPVPSDTESAQSIEYAILTWTLESAARQSPKLRVSQHSPAQRNGLERSWRANWSEALAPSGSLRSITLRRTNWASGFKLTIEMMWKSDFGGSTGRWAMVLAGCSTQATDSARWLGTGREGVPTFVGERNGFSKTR